MCVHAGSAAALAFKTSDVQRLPPAPSCMPLGLPQPPLQNTHLLPSPPAATEQAGEPNRCALLRAMPSTRRGWGGGQRRQSSRARAKRFCSGRGGVMCIGKDTLSSPTPTRHAQRTHTPNKKLHQPTKPPPPNVTCDNFFFVGWWTFQHTPLQPQSPCKFTTKNWPSSTKHQHTPQPVHQPTPVIRHTA